MSPAHHEELTALKSWRRVARLDARARVDHRSRAPWIDEHRGADFAQTAVDIAQRQQSTDGTIEDDGQESALGAVRRFVAEEALSCRRVDVHGRYGFVRAWADRAAWSQETRGRTRLSRPALRANARARARVSTESGKSPQSARDVWTLLRATLGSRQQEGLHGRPSLTE